ncbi:MAG: hypothetical protein CSA33_00240 [Desulfobulbus propionicus]|nr:MAG: hypothetical protein CSA33_00240 [Desulfobulbus propionicus]
MNPGMGKSMCLHKMPPKKRLGKIIFQYEAYFFTEVPDLKQDRVPIACLEPQGISPAGTLHRMLS